MKADADGRSASRSEIGERRRAGTRAKLIAAAMSVFSRLGPDTPAIDDFISEAGVARGTFYNYFQTREELLVAVATELSERLFARVAVLRRLPDPAERLGCTLRMFVRLAAEDPVAGWVIVRIALVAAPLGPAMRANLTHDITSGMASRRFSAASAQAACDLVLGLGLMAMRSVLRGEAGPGHAEDAAQMALTALGVQEAAILARVDMDEHRLAPRADGRSERRPNRTDRSASPSEAPKPGKSRRRPARATGRKKPA